MLLNFMEFKIKESIENYKRVLQISRKPDLEEFSSTAKICAIGILVVGISGFAVYLFAVMLG